MIEEFKRVLLLGLGAATTTKDELQAVVKSLVDKGKVTQEEAQEILCDLSKESKKEFQEATEKAKASLQHSMETLLSKVNFATKDDLSALEKRVKKLENKLKQQH